jgi:hypothetical protein
MIVLPTLAMGMLSVRYQGVLLEVHARGPRPASRAGDDDRGRYPADRAVLHSTVEHRLEQAAHGFGERPLGELREVPEGRDRESVRA